jgi:hypothetical protein
MEKLQKKHYFGKVMLRGKEKTETQKTGLGSAATMPKNTVYLAVFERYLSIKVNVSHRKKSTVI